MLIRVFSAIALLSVSPLAAAQSCQVIDDLVMYNFRGELRVMHPIVQGVPCGVVTRTAASGGGAVLSQNLPAVINGTPVPMTTSRTLTQQAIIRGASRALGLAGAGLAIAAIANDVKCRNTGSALLPIFECDAGGPTTSVPAPGSDGWRYQCSNGQFNCTRSEAINQCTATATANNAGNPNPVYCAYRNTTPGSANPTDVFRIRLDDGGWHQKISDGSIPAQIGELLRDGCVSGEPPSTLGGVPFCPSGSYTPASSGTVEGRVGAHPGLSPDLIPDMPPGTIQNSDPGVGPSIINGPAQSTGQTGHRQGTGTGGGTWTETRVPVSNITYNNNNTFTWTTTTTVTRVEGGVTTTTTEETGPGNPGTEGETITCGLPNTPPCKIDERGTPEAGSATTIMNPATQQLDQAADARKTQIEAQGGSGQRTTLPWSWAFPSVVGSCTNPSTTIKGRTFAPDLCGSPYTGWFRELLAWALAIATAVYCWQRASALGK